MKFFISTVLSLLTMLIMYAQSITKGYYITKFNDTGLTKIKFPKGFFGQNNFTNLIEVVDSVHGTKRFTPDDIKEYGFSDNGYKKIFFQSP